MSLALIFACFWVLAATMVAMLPVEQQRAPALGLLALAPALVGWVLVANGPLMAVVCVAGIASVMRRPLAALARRARRVRI